MIDFILSERLQNILRRTSSGDVSQTSSVQSGWPSFGCGGGGGKLSFVLAFVVAPFPLVARFLLMEYDGRLCLHWHHGKK